MQEGIHVTIIFIQALEDAIESMEYRVPKKCVKDSCPDHTL